MGGVPPAASPLWRLPGPESPDLGRGQGPWSSGGRFLFPPSPVSTTGLPAASPSLQIPSSPTTPISSSLLILLSTPRQSDPHSVVLEPMLEISTLGHAAHLAQAQPSNFLLPGTPGSIFVGTTGLGMAVPGLFWLPENRRRLSSEEAVRHLLRCHWICSLVCVPCICFTPVCTAVCVFKSTKHRVLPCVCVLCQRALVV